MVETVIPFNSEIKFTMFIRDIEELKEQSELMVIMKGAPERILSRCSKILINGEEVEFDNHYRE
jgi:sodium/potassium-transporting ATPase subunit alpha